MRRRAVALALVLLSGSAGAHAHEITDERAIRAILGEARGEGYAGMRAIAHAIRNRGHLRGVDGLHADISDADGAIRATAARAWRDSQAGEDPTHGADHWYAHKICRPWWAKYGTKTAVIGGHTFMKKVVKK